MCRFKRETAYCKKHYIMLFNYNYLFNYILKKLLGIFREKLLMEIILFNIKLYKVITIIYFKSIIKGLT